ncbi:MAG: hypothetical protein R2845_06415 [Thermomicrobiales bacterium]
MVNFIAGSFAVLYGVAYTKAMCRFSLSEISSYLRTASWKRGTSLAQVTRPGIGGLLVGLFSAPVAILFDVATYLVSSIAIFGIRAPEPDHVPSQESIRVRSPRVSGLSVQIGRFEFWQVHQSSTTCSG